MAYSIFWSSGVRRVWAWHDLKLVACGVEKLAYFWRNHDINNFLLNRDTKIIRWIWQDLTYSGYNWPKKWQNFSKKGSNSAVITRLAKVACFFPEEVACGVLWRSHNWPKVAYGVPGVGVACGVLAWVVSPLIHGVVPLKLVGHLRSLNPFLSIGSKKNSK